MLMVRMKSPEEKQFEVWEKGDHYIEIALNEVVFFIKKNHMLPLAILDDMVNTTADLDESRYEWIGFAEERAEYTLYRDDGISKTYTPQKDWKSYVFSEEDFADKYQILG